MLRREKACSLTLHPVFGQLNGPDNWGEIKLFSTQGKRRFPACARGALGVAGRKDHSRLPYLKRARECAFPVKWSLIPLPTKMRAASQWNPGPHQTECWTASCGITGPLRPESARESQDGVRPDHEWGFGLACARGALGPAGRKDHSRLPYLKRARECAFPVKWSLIPLPTKMRAASQWNPGPHQTECWTASCGITGPLRPESARESQDGVRPDHEWGFGLACARGALGPAGRKDHSRLPYLKRARECAFPVKWSLIPLPTKMRAASQWNPGPHQTECWTASCGITGPLRPESARESQDGVRPDHEWGFGLACARGALGPAGRKDHSRLPYLKRARECAFPVKWSLIPLPTKMRAASQWNPGPHQTECWTASCGITGPLRPESARESQDGARPDHGWGFGLARARYFRSGRTERPGHIVVLAEYPRRHVGGAGRYRRELEQPSGIFL